MVENSEYLSEEWLEFAYAIENKALGYRDAIFLPDQRGLCTLLGDMSAVSRVDSYFTNMKMPWEKSEPKEIVFSVGLFETLLIKNGTELNCLKASNFSYKYQSICITYSELLSMFAVGLDNGYIYFYKMDNNRVDKISELFSIKVHNKRVMGLAFDGLKGNLFSISEDGFLQVTDPVRQQILGCNLISVIRQQIKTLRTAL